MEVTSKDFESEVLKSELPVLVDFWAPWCGPCRMIAPVIEATAQKLAGKLKVAKINTDENPEVASRYGIMSIPTLIVFKGGNETERFVGYHPQAELEKKLNKYL